MEYTELYILFRRLQGAENNRPYKIPKNLEQYLEQKLSGINLENLKKLSDYFLTKFQNIDPELYLKCGFELYKSKFTYTKFFEANILKLYITRDKVIKANAENIKKSVFTSLEYIQTFMKDKQKNSSYSLLENYSKLKLDNKHQIVEDYFKNKIHISLFTYCLEKKYFRLTDYEQGLLVSFVSNYQDAKANMETVKKFIEKAEKIL